MTLSFVTAMSSSRTSTPEAMAYSNAGNVFSGRIARAPRCPCTRIFGAAGNIAAADQHCEQRSHELVLIPAQLALAAIAAAQTFLTTVVGTGILRAIDADVGRRLAADAACEG